MILEHSCREPEVVVKYCVMNFSNVVYREVISGIEASACARKLRLRLRLRLESWRTFPAAIRKSSERNLNLTSKCLVKPDDLQ